jgi:TonB family protein
MSSTSTAFIVTTSISGTSNTQIWNPELPLALGHPLRWIAERTQSGVRIRNLALTPGQVSSNSDSLCEISNDKLAQGLEIKLPNARGVSFRIRPAQLQAPAFGGCKGDRLSIYSCKGAWVRRSTLFEERFVAEIAGARVFSLREKNGTYSFDVHAKGVSLRFGDEAPRALAESEATHIQAAQIADAVLRFGSHEWRFGLSQYIPIAKVKSAPVDSETEWFRKALRYAAIGGAAFMVMAWLWPAPKPDTDVLIPAQFAKIILAKPPVEAKKAAAAAEGNVMKSAAVPEKVAKAAVVQAFRAKALSNAVSGLLRGGMTSLLAQSDFVAGKTASADARKSFDAKSTALASNGPAAGVSSDTNRTVATLGGSGEGKGTGYGKGEHAGIKGQGQAFVSMDVAGAAVDEGLTKDEVGEVIHRHLSEVRYCYESAMIRSPDLEGKLMVNFTIGGTGMVKSTEVKSSTLPDPRLDDCILRRLATWKFPNPRGAIDVAVTYPFIFKTLGR